MIKCKMQVVQKISRLNPYEAVLDAERLPICSIMLTAIPGDNTLWKKYVPSGQVELVIDSPEACSAFTLGAEYFVEFKAA